jgi:hypothetical protein
MLVFAATFVITLAFWPRQQPRQVLHCRGAGSEWKTYSIPAADPSLVNIESLLYRWRTPEFDRRYVTAKWQLEVARFYQQSASEVGAARTAAHQSSRTRPGGTSFQLSDTVATVSFELPAESDGDADAEAAPAGAGVRSAGYLQPVPTAQPTAAAFTLPGAGGSAEDATASGHGFDHQYWAAVIEQAERSIEATLRRTENAPVVMGEVRRAGWPSLAFHVALLLGLAAACGYMHWLRVAPLDSRTPFKGQRTAVLARLGTFGGLVGFSMICVLTLWI